MVYSVCIIRSLLNRTQHNVPSIIYLLYLGKLSKSIYINHTRPATPALTNVYQCQPHTSPHTRTFCLRSHSHPHHHHPLCILYLHTVRRQAEVTCGHSDPSNPIAVLGGLRADRSKWDVAPEKIILEHRQAVTGVKAIFGVLTGMLLLVSVVTRCRCWCCHSGKGKSAAKGHME